MQVRQFAVLLGLTAMAVGCGGEPEPAPVEMTPGLQAFVGARIIDGTGAAAVENGVLVVRDGRIEAVGASDNVNVPADAEQIDVSGRTIMPGMINAHGHVNNLQGLDPVDYTEASRFFAAAAHTVGVALLKPVLYSMRHAGPSNDIADRLRQFRDVKKRGRWAADSSVRRYEKAGMLNQELNRLPAAVRARALEAARRLSEVLGGTFPA